ncbi:hypothetical protein [Methanosarcina siciliae]|uniref:hypothetical protein n=1 Tax=Methanosarcina siciliae TaxID=38027 RepID=UPI000A6875A5|nr:hypothetical protein [Methanosarcina siciliae]
MSRTTRKVIDGLSIPLSDSETKVLEIPESVSKLLLYVSNDDSSVLLSVGISASPNGIDPYPLDTLVFDEVGKTGALYTLDTCPPYLIITGTNEDTENAIKISVWWTLYA